MPQTKKHPKRKQRACAVPLLSAAGLSLSLASGASAATEVPMPTQNTAANHEIMLGEEEIADVSLATFYVFDKENPRTFSPAVRLAGHGGGGGCRLRRWWRVRPGRRRRLRRWWRLRPRPRLRRLCPRWLQRLPRLQQRLRRLRRGLVGRLRRLRWWRLLVLVARVRLDLVLLILAKSPQESMVEASGVRSLRLNHLSSFQRLPVHSNGPSE